MNVLGRNAIFGLGDEPIDDDADRLDIPIHAFDVVIAVRRSGWATSAQAAPGSAGRGESFRCRRPRTPWRRSDRAPETSLVEQAFRRGRYRSCVRSGRRCERGGRPRPPSRPKHPCGCIRARHAWAGPELEGRFCACGGELGCWSSRRKRSRSRSWPGSGPATLLRRGRGLGPPWPRNQDPSGRSSCGGAKGGWHRRRASARWSSHRSRPPARGRSPLA
jgi:hypothetical protein